MQTSGVINKNAFKKYKNTYYGVQIAKKTNKIHLLSNSMSINDLTFFYIKSTWKHIHYPIILFFECTKNQELVWYC